MVLESLVPLTNLFFTSFSTHLVLQLRVDYKPLSLSCLYVLILDEENGMDVVESSYSHAI